MTLQDLTGKKLILKDYTFESGTLDLALDLEGHGALSVQVATGTLRIQRPLPKDPWVHLELIELGETLLAENGHYAPPPDDGRRMRELNSGAGLAYGRSVSEVKWALSFKGENQVVAACLLESLSDARVESAEG
jgi:hypothetical protein